MNIPSIEDIPPHPVLRIVVTADGRAFIDNTPVEVAFGTDPRVAAVNAAIAHAKELGRPLRVVLHETDGQRWPMVLTPEGGVYQGTRPFRSPRSAEVPSQHAVAAGVEDEDQAPLGPSPALPAPAVTPAIPPDGIDPANVPAWPLVRIVLTAEGKAFVNDEPVHQPEGKEPREAAVGAAAVLIGQLGLARPVRAVAVDPDGTAWPLIIHPNGTATAAGEPSRPERGHRWKRSRPGH